MDTMTKTQTVEVIDLGLPQIIGGNTGNIGRLLRTPGRKLELNTYHKRPACATSECVSCPYMRDGGHC